MRWPPLFLYTRFVRTDKKEKKLILPSDVERPTEPSYWDRPIFKPLSFLPKLIQVVLGLALIPTAVILFYNLYLETGFLGFLIFATFLPSMIPAYLLGVLVEKLKMEQLSGWAFSIGGISTIIFLTWYFA